MTDADTLLEDLAGRISTERARDAGAITSAEIDQFLAVVRTLDEADRFTVGIPLFTVVGTVPGKMN